MNTLLIIHHTEKLDTICYRLMRPADQEQRRIELVEAFRGMAADIGKLTVANGRPEWGRIHKSMMDLRIAAVHADESRATTFAHAGSEMSLLTSLHAFAAVLGFVLTDAATASIDEVERSDDAARSHVEGEQMEAAE